MYRFSLCTESQISYSEELKQKLTAPLNRNGWHVKYMQVIYTGLVCLEVDRKIFRLNEMDVNFPATANAWDVQPIVLITATQKLQTMMQRKTISFHYSEVNADIKVCIQNRIPDCWMDWLGIYQEAGQNLVKEILQPKQGEFTKHWKLH